MEKLQQLDSSTKLGSSPIGKLLFRMSLPAIISMLVQSLYNIVDSAFVASLGSNALTAVNLAFPMQMLVLSIALGISVGTNSIVARKLGQGDNTGASLSAQTGLFCAIVSGALFLVSGYFLSDVFLKFFSKDAEILSLGNDYLAIVTMFSMGMFVEMIFSKSLQATGNMVVPMISQLIGAVTNIILDPIFIFTFKMGVKGAAIATVIGQFVSMLYIIIAILHKKPCISLFFKKFRFKAECFMNILKVGLPATLMNAVGSFTILVLNLILVQHSTAAINVLGIYFKLQSFVFMPCFGLNQGAMPIMGYNYGAGNKKRFYKTFWLASIVACIIMVLGLLIFMVMPNLLLKIFNAENELLSLGIPALRILSLSFLPASFSIVCTSMFQAVGHGMKSMLMSLLRQVVFLIPAAFLMFKFVGVIGVWWSYPLAEFLTLAIFAPISLITMKKVFAKQKKLLSLVEDSTPDVFK